MELAIETFDLTESFGALTAVNKLNLQVEAGPLYAGAKECVKSMPNATFISFPGLRHVEVMTQRRLVLPHITKFLAKICQT